MHGDLSIPISNATVGAVFYFKVERDRTDMPRVFNVGNYRLFVTPANPPQTLGQIGEPAQYETLQTALALQGAGTQTNDRFDFIHYGYIDTAGDVDYYQFQSPNAGTTPQSMTVMVWGRDASLLPVVTVYDAGRNPITLPNITVLQNSNGTEILQINGALSNTTYFVSVANASATIPGRYSLGIDFSTRSHEADTSFASGSVSTTNGAPSQQAFRWVSIAQSTLFHLDISATNTGATVDTAIEVGLLDPTGHVVFDKVVHAGQTVSANLFLAAGNYELRVVGGSSTPAAQPPITFDVEGRGLTDPIDPQLINPGSPPATPPPFLWQFDPLFRDFLALINPYGSPILPGGGPGT
jgi:hypothetical protein